MVFVHRLPRWLHVYFGPHLTAVALDDHHWPIAPKLLSMPSTQLSRWRGGRSLVRDSRGRLTLRLQEGGFCNPTSSTDGGRTRSSQLFAWNDALLHPRG